MKIAVIGTGYVGLVTGTCFAETGNQVVCVDVDQKKIAALQNGKTPIYEPGLDVLLARNIREERIRFTDDLANAVKDALVVFLALPTPSGADGAADLKYVLKVAGELGDLITSYKIIVNKSTVPVGTAEKVAAILSEKLPSSLFDVVSNPEFLREGVAVDDFLKPERVVVGTASERAVKIMSDLYNPFVRQGNPIYFMDARSAEMTKYAANSFLAMKISFMNEIANLCERTGANVDWVRIGIGSDQRIGKRFLFPGIGYGGSCFPKDVLALNLTAQEHKYDFKLLQSVLTVNALQKKRLVQKLSQYFDHNLQGKQLALWGLAFKPETDDIRDAPSIEIIGELLAAGAHIKVYDPVATENVRQLFGDQLDYSGNQYEALRDADALLILTEWSEFRNPDFEKIKQHLKAPVIFDGRNVYTLEKMKELGFHYESIGRSKVN
ncbi:UDP-glucose/GDP-mannose dehydrogenase family protein [Niabella sp. CC-SYL272]|uniref:UDP-glucose dehydrogenase family protein n=1 Tax=Niabella agricola TaxID=2891571 RepID=UPI001F325BA9|nr:UDP-glucose/GDP-mannose dehydrogenase family protein [Niabella agricola]MCF3109015.1 UDP-glucose/GDP-mannose dehydrogenase family protein [Niabella agricola]